MTKINKQQNDKSFIKKIFIKYELFANMTINKIKKIKIKNIV